MNYREEFLNNPIRERYLQDSKNFFSKLTVEDMFSVKKETVSNELSKCTLRTIKAVEGDILWEKSSSESMIKRIHLQIVFFFHRIDQKHPLYTSSDTLSYLKHLQHQHKHE